MSRSVKNFYPWHPTPVNTRRLYWRVAIVLSIIQIVHARNPHSLVDNHNPDDYGTGSTFRFKNPRFEISYDVFDTDDDVNEAQNRMQNHHEQKAIIPTPKSDREFMQEMIDKVLLSSDEPATQGNRNIANRSGPRMRSNENGPPECRKKLICDEDADYPESDIENAVRNKADLHPMFHVDEMADDFTSQSDGLCESTSRRYFPRLVRLKVDGEWIRVANTPTFRQGIVISECKTVGTSCIQHFMNTISDYTAVCKQHYSDRNLVVIDATDTKPFISTYRIPTGCCCYKTTNRGY